MVLLGLEIGGILSVIGAAAAAHSWFTGLKTGSQIEHIAREIESTKVEIQRLSDHILFAPSLEQVRDTTKTRILARLESF